MSLSTARCSTDRDRRLRSNLWIRPDDLVVAGAAVVVALFAGALVILGCERHCRDGADARVSSELARWEPCCELRRGKCINYKVPARNGKGGAYHLVNLLECAAVHLWEVKICPQRGDQARRGPDVAVFGAPVQRVRVDKVRGGEGGEPGAQEADRSRQAEGVAAKTLRGELAAAEPRVRRHHAVVGHDVDD